MPDKVSRVKDLISRELAFFLLKEENVPESVFVTVRYEGASARLEIDKNIITKIFEMKEEKENV